MLTLESNKQGIVVIPLFENTKFSNGQELDSEIIELSLKAIQGFFSYHYAVSGSATIKLYISHTGKDWVEVDSIDCSNSVNIKSPRIPVTKFLKFKVIGSSDGAISLALAVI